MTALITSSKQILEDYLSRVAIHSDTDIDRKEVVAHATLSALRHHWPSLTESEIVALLDSTQKIKDVERSRWMTQRRIAISKLASILKM